MLKHLKEEEASTIQIRYNPNIFQSYVNLSLFIKGDDIGDSALYQEFDRLSNANNREIYPKIKPNWKRFWPLVGRINLTKTLYILLTIFFISVLICCLFVILGFSNKIVLLNVIYNVLAFTSLFGVVITFGLLCFFDPAPAAPSVLPTIFVLPSSCIPLVPALAIIINTLLLLSFKLIVWIRFVIWMGLGMIN